MTELYIDGQLAVLPEGFSFTFTSENPYFTRSSNYSMDVELPMSANYAIFKHINRLDVTKKKTILPATLIVDAKCLLYGSAVLLSVEDTLVKVQLVSGNAEFNLLTNDEIYIDELKLGGPYVPPMSRSERRKSGQCSCVWRGNNQLQSLFKLLSRKFPTISTYSHQKTDWLFWIYFWYYFLWQ